ncbi:hypothetical protein [Streptomyces sp. NPDC102360]
MTRTPVPSEPGGAPAPRRLTADAPPVRRIAVRAVHSEWCERSETL